MADIAGALVKVNDIEVAQDEPDTEALWNKIGANINELIDDNAEQETDIGALETAVAALQVAGSLIVDHGNGTLAGSLTAVLSSGRGAVDCAAAMDTSTGQVILVEAGGTVVTATDGVFKGKIVGQDLQLTGNTFHHYIAFIFYRY